MKLKVFLLMLTLVMTSAAGAKAQVTIGMRKEPSPGSLLDLKEMSAADNTTATKGLGLPRVSLSNLNRLYPMLPAGYSDEEGTKHVGLVVYNMNRYANNRDVIEGEEYDPTGLRVWNGSRWQSMKKQGTLLEKITRVDYVFTGTVQTFTAPQDGEYLLEAWGAGIATSPENYPAGYCSGVIHLAENQVIYVYVGGRNNMFNGGGSASNGNKGCGATDFRLVAGDSDTEWDKPLSLNSRILVSGSSGGVGKSHSSRGQYAGGLEAWSRAGKSYCATQTQPGSGGAFGQGGPASSSNSPCGGGGGYYGGKGEDFTWAIAGSGSSFISGMTGCVAIDPTATNEPRTQDAGANTTALNYHSSFGTSPTWADGDEIIFTHCSMIDGRGYEWNTGARAAVSIGVPDLPDGTPLPDGNLNSGRARIMLLVPVQ
ncbi:MAG: hypothetical protein LBH12_01190 [Dysgonamonadaceae bacterium]|jgi:hypothetical protein|nr:hypothetical protein [Dysgonamonadaceae bacterium]